MYSCDCAVDDGQGHVTDRKNTSATTTTTTYPTLDVILLQRTRRRHHGVVVTDRRRRTQRRPRRTSRDRRRDVITSRNRRDVNDIDEERACTMETMTVSFAGLIDYFLTVYILVSAEPEEEPPYPPAMWRAHVAQGPHVMYGKKFFLVFLMFSKYL